MEYFVVHPYSMEIKTRIRQPIEADSILSLSGGRPADFITQFIAGVSVVHAADDPILL